MDSIIFYKLLGKRRILTNGIEHIGFLLKNKKKKRKVKQHEIPLQNHMENKHQWVKDKRSKTLKHSRNDKRLTLRLVVKYSLNESKAKIIHKIRYFCVKLNTSQ